LKLNDRQLHALTLNNLGCAYKKDRKPNVALNYMTQALKLEQEDKAQQSQLAGTKLNICAILSSLSRHSESISYCLSAINDLSVSLKTLKVKGIKDKEK